MLLVFQIVFSVSVISQIYEPIGDGEAGVGWEADYRCSYIDAFQGREMYPCRSTA